MGTRTLVSIIILVAIIAGAWWLVARGGSAAPSQTPHQIAQATFACSNNKSISAIFYEGSSTPSESPDQPPTPGGSVALSLSDGRTMTLPQTISADGGRYANADESLVFWTKGNGATITEGTQPTYTCIVAAKDPGGLPGIYENGTAGFSIRYPSNYTIDPNFKNIELGDKKPIYGVQFKIASTTAAGTNLAADTYLSVEEIPQAKSCDASLFIYPGVATSTLEENGTTYSIASSTDAGAGNRYEEHIFAIPGTNPCVAVRYFIHYSVFENYPPGSITRFDEGKLIAQFDAIRRSLSIDQ